MTKKELIKLLEEYPNDAEIQIIVSYPAYPDVDDDRLNWRADEDKCLICDIEKYEFEDEHFCNIYLRTKTLNKNLNKRFS